MNDFARIAALLARYKVLAAIFATWAAFEILARWDNIAGGYSSPRRAFEQVQHSGVLPGPDASRASAERVQRGEDVGGAVGKSGQGISRNPFLRPASREARAAVGSHQQRPEGFEPPQDPAALTLQAIAVRKDRHIAIVNNRPLSVGDKYRGYVVLEINKDFVLLKNEGGTLRLSRNQNER